MSVGFFVSTFPAVSTAKGLPPGQATSHHVLHTEVRLQKGQYIGGDTHGPPRAVQRQRGGGSAVVILRCFHHVSSEVQEAKAKAKAAGVLRRSEGNGDVACGRVDIFEESR